MLKKVIQSSKCFNIIPTNHLNISLDKWFSKWWVPKEKRRGLDRCLNVMLMWWGLKVLFGLETVSYRLNKGWKDAKISRWHNFIHKKLFYFLIFCFLHSFLLISETCKSEVNILIYNKSNPNFYKIENISCKCLERTWFRLLKRLIHPVELGAELFSGGDKDNTPIWWTLTKTYLAEMQHNSHFLHLSPM